MEENDAKKLKLVFDHVRIASRLARLISMEDHAIGLTKLTGAR